MSLAEIFARKPQNEKTASGVVTLPKTFLPPVGQAATNFGGYKIDRVRANVGDFRKLVEKRQTERNVYQKQLDDEMLRHAEAEKNLGVNDLVQILLQKTSDYARQQAKSRIEDIVTSALTVVFGQGYRFWIDLVVRANRPEADYWLEKDGVATKLEPPDYDRGGGVADVISMALRLAVAELDGVKGAFWLDEIGKHVSAEYAADVAFFLKEYSQKFNRQIILITHNTTLAEAGEVSIGVTQKAGRSEVRTI
jgi:hypothetical protein